jgi:hypothetical protein
MDLVTLIAACALSVEPKVMHALIWKQSGGETFSFSVPGESLPRVLPTIQDAIREARAVRPNGGRIRVGLTGLSIDPRSATAVLFAPCLNITVAARPITQLAERCKTTSKPDPIYCAVAAYRGSCDRPDPRFADAVRATVEKGSAPNFDMPKDAYFDSNDVAFDTLTPGPHATLSAPALTPDDLERGWSSALFRGKQRNRRVRRSTCRTTVGLQDKCSRLVLQAQRRQQARHQLPVYLSRDGGRNGSFAECRIFSHVRR